MLPIVEVATIGKRYADRDGLVREISKRSLNAIKFSESSPKFYLNTISCCVRLCFADARKDEISVVT